MSLTAESAFKSNHYLPEPSDVQFTPVVRNVTARSIFPVRYMCVLAIMLNPLRRVSIERVKLIRKLGWSLIAFQILDGLLTYQGLYLYGNDAEGNPLIRMLMQSFGVFLGLGFTKLFTISVIMTILVAGYKLNWLTYALRTLLGYYLLFALLPWSFLIIQAYLQIS